jgi:hypothetical protein
VSKSSLKRTLLDDCAFAVCGVKTERKLKQNKKIITAAPSFLLNFTFLCTSITFTAKLDIRWCVEDALLSEDEKRGLMMREQLAFGF